MTLFWRAHFALAVGYALTAAATGAGAQSLAVQSWAADMPVGQTQGDPSGAELALYDGDATETVTANVVDDTTGDIQLTQFSSAIGGGSAGACAGGCFFGGEYLHVRANFSQSISHISLDQNAGPNGTFTYNQFDYDYDPSFRIYGGYRWCECGCEVRFAYSSFDSDAAFQSAARTADVIPTAPFEVITFGPGDTVSGTSSVSIDDFDFGFSKTIPLGSPLCCGSPCGGDCCGDCCGGCGCWCPAWDITWSGAIRFASVDAEQNFASNIVSTAVAGRTATSTMSFDGVGLRTGLLGRRYFGKTGIASVYVKGDISLLVGDADYTAVGTEFSRHSISCTHVIPVTEIEAGGTLFLTKNASITGGYMIAAWHDLGFRTEYDFGGAGVQLESWDDANILGLDGFFLRGEVAF